MPDEHWRNQLIKRGGKQSADSRRAARQRGRNFEYKIAKMLGGHRHTGENGDVEARGYRVECKYRSRLGLESGYTLKEWIEQAERNVKDEPGKKWALAITGGQSFGSKVFFLIPSDEFIRLTDLDEDRQILDAFKVKYPNPIKRLEVLFREISNQLSDMKGAAQPV